MKIYLEIEVKPDEGWRKFTKEEVELHGAKFLTYAPKEYVHQNLLGEDYDVSIQYTPYVVGNLIKETLSLIDDDLYDNGLKITKITPMKKTHKMVDDEYVTTYYEPIEEV